ncbi:Ig-like domain-containing protein [Aeromicrobium massiliense]|uniref:Ig-like domain-containing protein n=1 Tax=Aeromicrobium massiliense TaxID=1464554 RepID=UPI0002D4E2E2|nr:Ig-like domain-containing protein [Aeromicrobium massiliense]
MTPRRRLAAAALGAALLGGTLAAAPASAQQREYTNPLSTPTVTTDLDVPSLSVDATPSTLDVRLRTENLGGDYTVELLLAQRRTLDGGHGINLRAEVSDDVVTSLSGFAVPDVTKEGDVTPLPASTLGFQRTGGLLRITLATTSVVWDGGIHVGGRLRETSGNDRFFAAAFNLESGLPPTLFGPITTAADPTSTTLGLSASRQVYGQTRPTVLTAKVPAGVTGSVTFRDGARTLGVVKQAGGTARLTLPRTLLAGTHTLTATFVPTDRTRHSTSTAATWLTVSPHATTTAVRLSKAKQRLRGSKPARATITVSGRAPGTVTVYDGRRKLRTVRLSAGRATYTLPRTLKVGRHSIKAVYRPATTGTYAASTSSTVRLTVTR